MRYAPLAALVLATGCLFSNNDRLTVSVNFQIVEPAAPTAPAFQVIGSAIQIQHRFETPTPCWSFGASATQTDEIVEFILTRLADQTGGCTGGATVWAYNALISGARTGTTRIAVTVDDGTARDRQEYQLPAATK